MAETPEWELHNPSDCVATLAYSQYSIGFLSSSILPPPATWHRREELLSWFNSFVAKPVSSF